DQQTQGVAAIGEPERSAVACAIGRGEAAGRRHGEKTGRLLDTLRTEHQGPIVCGSRWLEQRSQDFPAHQGVHWYPASQVYIKRIVLREHDQRADLVTGEVEDGVGHLRQSVPLECASTPPHQVEETEAFQDSADLGLKDDDEDEPEHGPERLKEPARENQTTPACQQGYPPDDRKPNSREEGAAPTYPEGALVKQIRHQQDIKHALPVEVAYIAGDVVHASTSR